MKYFGDFMAGNFMAHRVTFEDFMAGNFLAGDFLGGYPSRLSDFYLTVITMGIIMNKPLQ